MLDLHVLFWIYNIVNLVQVSSAALQLFKFGQEEAAKRGLLLVDTKYEFGKGPDGEIYLIDEVCIIYLGIDSSFCWCYFNLRVQIHTPDSSRYWLDTYEQRHKAGKEPENIDKEFLRLWFRSVCDPYKDKVRGISSHSNLYLTWHVNTYINSDFQPTQELPTAPKELVCELSKRYVYLFEKITGQQFQASVMQYTSSLLYKVTMIGQSPILFVNLIFCSVQVPSLSQPINERMKTNLKKAGH